MEVGVLWKTRNMSWPLPCCMKRTEVVVSGDWDSTAASGESTKETARLGRRDSKRSETDLGD